MIKKALSDLSLPEINASPETIRNIGIVLAMLLVIAAPFILRPADPGGTRRADKTLVILSPHNETIRSEFSLAFRDYMFDKTGISVRIDWRTPGGTTEIERIIRSSFRGAFEQYWTTELKKKWDEDKIGDIFGSSSVNLEEDSPAAEARIAFLSSNIGIGVDLLFGGGEYAFLSQARAGYIVDSGIFDRQPDWFSDDVIPPEVSGERFYDPEHRWIGNCLSSFGIVYNADSLARLGINEAPRQWSDLGKKEYYRQIALADPTKSGSATKAFEMLIQQQMHEAQRRVTPRAFEEPERTELRAVREGWIQGLNLIQRIGANSRYFTDSSSKIPLDVSQGNAAAGMCIDFYGRTANELVQKADGTSRVGFVTPLGGSSVSVDPVAMFRGAPEPELALAFIEFLLGPEGQKLWNYRRGEPGGPYRRSLRRLPIRKDLYTEEHFEHFADREERPFDTAMQFEYVRHWTEPAFSPIRFIIRCMCLDSHEELTDAWEKLIENDFPPAATRTFFSVGFVDYDKALGHLKKTLDSGYALSEVTLARQITNQFRSNYRRAAQMAERGQ